MNELKLFETPEFGKVRAVAIDGEPWFVGKDVAKALGYTDLNKAIAMHVDEEDKLNDKTASSLGQRGGWFINESGVYSMIFGSKLPEAKAFKHWITSVVIPSIRKNGAYIAGQETMSDAELMASALFAADRMIKERDARIAELQEENEVMQPKAQYFDYLVDKRLLTNFRDSAKEIGVTQTELINYVIDNNYCYRTQNGEIRPHAQYVGTLFKLKDIASHYSRYVGVQTLLTPKGKETFRLLMTGDNDDEDEVVA